MHAGNNLLKNKELIEAKDTAFDRLIQAVVNGNVDEFDKIVRSQPTVLDQTIPETGDTIAHVIAVQSRQPKFFFRLQFYQRLDLLNKKNNLGTLPMHYAALFNSEEMVAVLCSMQDKRTVHAQVTSVIHAVKIPVKLEQIFKESDIDEKITQKPESALKMSTYRGHIFFKFIMTCA